MQLKERLEYILKHNKIKPGISEYEFAKSVGTYPAKFAEIKSGKVKTLSAEIALEISKQYNVEFLWILTGEGSIFKEKNDLKQIKTTSKDEINAKLYPDVMGSCGGGVFEQSQNFEMVKIPKYLIAKYKPNKEYSIITAKGDSMSGSIEDGDKLLIESFDSEQITDNQIYVFCYKEEIFVKRLCKNLNEIIVKSDNDFYKPKHIENEDMNNIHIIGKVVCSVRNYV